MQEVRNGTDHDADCFVRIQASVRLADLVVQSSLSDHADVYLHDSVNVHSSIHHSRLETYIISFSRNPHSLRRDLPDDSNGNARSGERVS